jgi:hypothetical protein
MLHRTVALLAAISLFVGTLAEFNSVMWGSAAGGSVMIGGYLATLICAILAVTVRGRRGMLSVDIAILVTAVAVRLPAFLASSLAAASCPMSTTRDR